jgi:quinol monooxygenase YgiN
MAYVVAARWVAKPGHEDAVLKAVRALTEPSRAEPGTLVYQAHRDPSDPRVFFFYEQYANREAAAAHRETPHFQQHITVEALPLLELRERAEYETI